MPSLADLFPFFVFAIPLVALIVGPLKRWIALKERQLELAATTAGEQAAQYAATIARLEQRVAVLERIATDRSLGLAAEIDNLRTAPLN